MDDAARPDLTFFVNVYRWVDGCVFANRHVFLKDNMRMNLTVVGNFDVGTDVSKSADVDVCSDLRAVVNKARLFNDGLFFIHAVVER